MATETTSPSAAADEGDAGLDFELVRTAMNRAVPFNRHCGAEVTEVGPDGGTARLDDGPHLRNHVGTVHAGALFLVAELAGGAAFVGAFAPHMGDIRFVAKAASITYCRPATGPVTATAFLATRSPERVLAALSEKGSVRVEAGVEVFDEEGTKVAALTITYAVKPNRTAEDTTP